MERIQIRLSTDERAALVEAAWASRRHPRDLAEYVLRRWLVRRGFLDDPTAAGKLRTSQEVQHERPAQPDPPTDG